MIRFGPYRIDVPHRKLLRGEEPLKIENIPLDILLLLIRERDRIVTREEIAEQVWGRGRHVEAADGINTAIRKVRRALDDNADEPRYIQTMIGRGYRFTGVIVSELATEPAAPLPVRPEAEVRGNRRVPAGSVLVTGAALVLALGGWFGVVRPMESTSRPFAAAPRLTPATALIGSETMATFSPDGQQMAYVWNGEKEDNSDIYVKLTGSATALQLTNHPGADLFPAWSPDGRHIAFVRIHGKTGIYLISPPGGQERLLAELPGLDLRPPGPETRGVGDLLYPLVQRPSWSADSKFLVLSRNSEPSEPGDGSVLLIPVESGEPRPILIPAPGSYYVGPTLSPDGRRLAVSFCTGTVGVSVKCDLQLVSLNQDLRPQGEALTILPNCKLLRGIAWMPDGNSLIVSGFNLPRYYLWRVSARKPVAPERIELAGIDALWPAMSKAGGQLAFTRSILQADLWKMEKGGKASPFLSSTARDTDPRFSPDGKRIAFLSARGGPIDVWIARADGSGLAPITRNRDRNSGSFAWSPDSEKLAFSLGGADDSAHIWTVDAAGGSPRQFTRNANKNMNPAWSPNDQWIYFASDRSGRLEIWRAPVGGGTEEQITRNGSYSARESADGKSIFFLKSGPGGAGIFAQSLAGGQEQRIIKDPIVRGAFDVNSQGIYYVTPHDEYLCDLRFYEFVSRRTTVVAAIERPFAFGLSVSPDQKTFLYSRPVTGSDLMLLENFR